MKEITREEVELTKVARTQGRSSLAPYVLGIVETLLNSQSTPLTEVWELTKSYLAAYDKVVDNRNLPWGKEDMY